QLLFEGGAPGRPVIVVDGDGAAATSPVELLLLAAATCSAADVVTILRKQRVVLRALDVRVSGTRREAEPRRYTALHMVFTVSGDGADEAKARRGGAGGEGRFALSAAGGDYDGVVGMRLQATAQLLLRPGDRTGLGPYAGLGLAFVGAEATHGAGYLTAVLGVDAAPGRGAGW